MHEYKALFIGHTECVLLGPFEIQIASSKFSLEY